MSDKYANNLTSGQKRFINTIMNTVMLMDSPERRRAFKNWILYKIGVKFSSKRMSTKEALHILRNYAPECVILVEKFRDEQKLLQAKARGDDRDLIESKESEKVETKPAEVVHSKIDLLVSKVQATAKKEKSIVAVHFMDALKDDEEND